MSRTTRKRAQNLLRQSMTDPLADGTGVRVSNDEHVEHTENTSRPCALLESVDQTRIIADLDSIETEDTLESGSAGLEPRAAQTRADGQNDRNDGNRLTSAFGIHYDGSHYRYNGYRYDQLAEAVSYAELMQSRPLRTNDPGPWTDDEREESRGAPEKALMARHSISFSAGVFRYCGFHYDRLADAVDYARISLRNPMLGSGT